MKVDEVPQDGVAYYAGARKAVYALNREGHYDTVASTGWEAEAVVTTGPSSKTGRSPPVARRSSTITTR